MKREEEVALAESLLPESEVGHDRATYLWVPDEIVLSSFVSLRRRTCKMPG